MVDQEDDVLYFVPTKIESYCQPNNQDMAMGIAFFGKP